MPSFTFEKISPPVLPNMAVSATPIKPRGVIVQLLDKLTETRLKRDAGAIQHSATYTENDITPQRTRS